MSHREVSSSYPASCRRHFVQITLAAALRIDDDSLRDSRPLLLFATRLATSIEALAPEKPDESASCPAACLWFVLRTAAFSMDLSRAGEVAVSMISKNWKGEGQVHLSLSRLRKVAPTGPFSLRHRSGRCGLPRSQILRMAGRLRTFCVAASQTSLLRLKVSAVREDVVGSSYHGQKRREGPVCRQRAVSRRGQPLQVPPFHVGDT